MLVIMSNPSSLHITDMLVILTINRGLDENGLDEFSIVSPVRGHDEMRRRGNGI